MRSFKRYLALFPAAVLLVACGRQERTAGDEALSRDLALAATAQPYPQQFVSPQEMGYGQPYGQPYQQAYPQYGYAAPQGYYPAPQPAIYRYPAPAPRSTSTRSGTIYRAPAPAPEPAVKRNTKRDALIGATAGAIAGSVIGRDVKGAVIGAAAGGLLGAVIGHTVDVERRP